MRILILETGCKSKILSRGFTLIEVLVVILIIGITTTLITLNFSSLNSIEKQSNTIDKRFSYLTEESIITGKVIGWYATNSSHYAAYLSNNNPKDDSEYFLEPSWTDNSSIKKIYFDKYKTNNFPIILSVAESSPGYEAGLKSNDIVIKINGDNTQDFRKRSTLLETLDIKYRFIER